MPLPPLLAEEWAHWARVYKHELAECHAGARQDNAEQPHVEQKADDARSVQGGGAKEEVADNDDAAGAYSYHSGTSDGEETSASDGDFPTHDAEAEAEERAANAARQLAQ